MHVVSQDRLHKIQPPPKSSDLLLVDSLDIESGSLPEYLDGLSSVVLLNIEDEDPVLRTFIALPEVKGVFGHKVTQDRLLKGIKCLFSGEYWLPRKLLMAHLEMTRNQVVSPCQDANCLTKRELQILKFLENGKTNTQIADHLCISTHTVKTHLYHMFKKIKASNRIQALNWARERRIL